MSKFSHFLRRFIAVVLTTPLGLLAADLETGFQQPPSSAKPRTLWMWMNGNVTPGGITLDLEAMQRVGLGGAMIFNIGEFIPKGPVDYGRQPWIDMMVHAAREADRLGLVLGMHNCPGWSSSGGPWITPEMSMQRLVWSETRVRGGPVDLVLQQPFTRLDFYRDIRVLAFPTLPGEERSFADLVATIRNARGTVDKRVLTDGDLVTTVQVTPDNPLILEFAEPFNARAVTVQYTSGGATVGFTLESSDDGTNFTTVAKLAPASPRAIEDASLVASFEPVRARLFRVVPARTRGVSEIELHAAPRLPDWNFKANYVFRPARWEPQTNNLDSECAIRADQIIDLTSNMDANGRLLWNAPTGSWTVLRFGHTSRGQDNIAAPDAGVGLEVNKMSRRATAFHFEHGISPLLRALGPLAGKSFTELEVDSYEVGVQNWTAGFEDAFHELNGYELVKFLPAMTGRVVQDAETSEKFLWDLRRTHAQLVADCYYGELRALANRHGLRLLAEPYGAGPGAYDELQIAGRVDGPMGEFWAHFPWDDMMSVRLAASAAHIQGRAIVAAEAFTATIEQSRFMDYPFGLKATGDLAFSLGLNQMYFHRYAHQPHPSAVPGMTMGPWGFNFDRNNSWFEQSKPWLEYLARCQFLLRQGHYAADVLYFAGEGSPQISKRIVPDLPEGFQFDVVDAETLLDAAGVENGRIRLRGENGYRLLALPPDLKAVTLPVLRKLQMLVTNGAVLAGLKPQFSPALRDAIDGAKEFENIASSLWTGDASPVAAGSGRVYSTTNLAEVLRLEKVAKAFEYSGERPDAALVWNHRKVGDADVYFVANRQRRMERVTCSFGVENRQPEVWFPETGEVRSVAVYEAREQRTRVTLELKPADSVFVVFRQPPSGSAASWITRNGVRLDSAEAGSNSTQAASAAAAWTNDFSVSTWIKPDTDMMAFPSEGGNIVENGKSWVVPVPPTSRLLGEKHSVAGIAAGRNGIIVAERAGDRLIAMLVSRTNLSGWTHLAVVWRAGKPALFVNGAKLGDGVASGSAVHPAAGFGPPERRIVYYFDGDIAGLDFHREALSETQVADLHQRGLAAPQLTTPVEVFLKNGRPVGEVWQPGVYELSGGEKLSVDSIPASIQIESPWTVSFPTNAGVPDPLTFAQLQALQTHDKPNVRFFGGTAIYRNQFSLEADAFGNGRRLWLDLGPVAVIAQVRLNGRDCGTAWRPPYRLEITSAVEAGTNELEVAVTTLLANRIIGDEYLPPEQEYNSRTGAILAFPDWYIAGAPKPGPRFTFSAWRFFNLGQPLLESGLRGPVRILTSVTGEFTK